MRIYFLFFLFIPHILLSQFEKERILSIHSSPVTCIFINESKNDIYSGDSEGRIYITNLITAEESRQFIGHTGKITHFDLNSTGDKLLTASYDGTIKVWDAQDGNVLKVIHNSTYQSSGTIRGNEPTFALFEQGDSTIIYGGYNCRVHTTNLNNGTSETLFQGFESGVTCGVFLADKNKICFAVNNSIYIYNLAERAITDTLFYGGNAFDDSVCEIAIVPSRPQILAAWLFSGVIVLWDIRNKKIEKSLKIATQKGSSMLSIANNNWMLTGNNASDAILWDLKDTTLIQRLSAHRSDVKSVALKKDASYAITGGNDNKVMIWKRRGFDNIDSTRKIILQDSVMLGTNLVDLVVYDAEQEDGDTLSLILDGKIILKEYKLVKAPHTVSIALPNNNNIITAFAHNEGSRSPNTAAIDIFQSGRLIKKIQLRSSKKTTAALLLKVNQN